MTLICCYLIFLLLFGIYGYALMDPNITFLNSSVWQVFREKIIYFGYYQRELSSVVFIIGIIGLFLFHYLLQKKEINISPLKLSFIIGGILTFSYPFLSHDLFNYMFDAKIVTNYHQNPYVKKALDFPHDQWTRFMHWTHRTYPYGPVFLLITLIPSFLSLGKFLLTYLLFKILFVSFYCLAVWALQKKDKKAAMMFATHPLIIVEGLMNSHNDLIGISLALVGLYYISVNKNIIGKMLILLSIGIKYVTLPYIVANQSKKLRLIMGVAVITLMTYWVLTMEVQPWYFMLLFGLLPLYKDYFTKLWILFAGLLFAYYPYVRFGGWDKQYEVNMKHQIILVFFGINVVYLLVLFSRKRFFSK